MPPIDAGADLRAGHVVAWLDRAETDWMWNSLHYPPDIIWAGCCRCGHSRPLAPGVQPFFRCDRTATGNRVYTHSGERCNGLYTPFNVDQQATFWATLTMGGPEALEPLFRHLRYSTFTRQWEWLQVPET